MIRSCAHPDVNLIFGVAFDDSLNDEMVVTVIATGFEPDKNFDIPDYRVKSNGSKADVSKADAQQPKEPEEDVEPFDIMSIFGRR